jgi:hypothetical protein
MKELIDGGEQFLSRSETLFKRDLKVDFLMLKEVHGKSLTLGELIAHLTRCNNLSDINSNISTLLGCDFLEGLRLVHDRWDHEVSKNPRVPIISNPDKTYRSVDEIFSLRHIICHELANDKKFTFEKIQELIKDCSTFLKASREFIAEKLHPGYPLTQSDMNEWTGLELKKSLDKMEDIERKIVGILNEEEVKKFYQLQRDWAAYAEKWISFDADNFLGGTIRHSIYNSVHKEEVDSRIKTLEQYYEKYKRMRS